MKNRLVYFCIVLLFVFVFTTCGDDPKDGTESKKEFTVTAADFDSTLKEILKTSGEYVVYLTEDLLDYPGIGLDVPGVKITLKGNGHKIVWDYDEEIPLALFGVNGSELILENVKITRAEGNTQQWAIIGISSGKLEIKDEVIITNQISTGVWMSGGSLIMSGGKITGCEEGIRMGITSTDAGSDSTLTISGGTISNNNEYGICIADKNKNTTINMIGGTISGNNNGIGDEGDGNVININGGTISNNTYNGILLWEPSTNTTLTMSNGTITGNSYGIGNSGTDNKIIINGGTISNNVDADTGWGVGIGLWGNSSTFTMTDGIITDNNNGVNSGGNGNSINITGGTISNNTENGIGLGGSNNTLTTSNGIISGNLQGIINYGDRNVIKIEGGTISNNTDNGILLWEPSTNTTLTMSNGTITENSNGIVNNGDGNVITITGGTISDNDEDGIMLWESPNTTLTVTGGTISGNGNVGIAAWNNEDSCIKNCIIDITGCTIEENTEYNIAIVTYNTPGNDWIGIDDPFTNEMKFYLETDEDGRRIESSRIGW